MDLKNPITAIIFIVRSGNDYLDSYLNSNEAMSDDKFSKLRAIRVDLLNLIAKLDRLRCSE